MRHVEVKLVLESKAYKIINLMRIGDFLIL